LSAVNNTVQVIRHAVESDKATKNHRFDSDAPTAPKSGNARSKSRGVMLTSGEATPKRRAVIT
jgi:hypothetical protein